MKMLTYCLAFLVTLTTCVFASFTPLQMNEDTNELRETLKQISSNEDENQFLFEYMGFLRKNHIDVLLRKGDRIQAGKCTVVFDESGELSLQSKGAKPKGFENLSHFVLDDGTWTQSGERPDNASHFLVSTTDLVFVVDLSNQRVGIVKKSKD